MRQALHILRKDIRYLWIEISAALLAVGLFTFTAARPSEMWNAPLPRTVASFLMQFMLPFAWWTLITRAVHAEPLIGDRHFWPTRPYAWRSLLAAKAMLFVLFVNLPMLIAQTIVIAAHGFSPAHEISGLLWSQVLLAIGVILPIATIAAVTSSVVQFLVLGLVAFVCVMLLSMRFLVFASLMAGGGWGPMEWIHTSYSLLLAAIAAPAILIWQYARRRTVAVRAVTVGAVVALVIGTPFSWNTAFALQQRFSPNAQAGASIRAGYYSDFQWMTRALVERDGRVSLHIPLQLTGMAEDMQLEPQGLGADIEGAGGATWRCDPEHRANVSRTGQLITLLTTVDGAFYRSVKDQPVRVHGFLYATLYGNRHVTKVPFTDRPQSVPGLGICAASSGKGAPYFLTCSSVFRPQPDLVSVRFEEGARETSNYGANRLLSYSPFPAEFGFDPVNGYFSYSIYRGRLDAVTVTSVEPVAYVRIPLAIDGLVLVKYEKTL